jgi:hypothetical protein
MIATARIVVLTSMSISNRSSDEPMRSDPA